jgi:hypothetical protein
MKITAALRPLATWLGLLLGLLLLTGCASRKIDWNARVGTYTFDQAVIELGPPAKQARLTDGTLVAEWQTQRGYTQAYYTPYYGYRSRYYGGYYATPIISSSPDVFLRLTFDAAGKMIAWKKIIL